MAVAVLKKYLYTKTYTLMYLKNLYFYIIFMYMCLYVCFCEYLYKTSRVKSVVIWYPFAVVSLGSHLGLTIILILISVYPDPSLSKRVYSSSTVG